MENEITIHANTYTPSQNKMIISYRTTTFEPSEEKGVSADEFIALPDRVILFREFIRGQGKINT